jgi:hypothetical protein
MSAPDDVLADELHGLLSSMSERLMPVLAASRGGMSPALLRTGPQSVLEHSVPSLAPRGSLFSAPSERSMATGISVEDVGVAVERFFESSGAIDRLEAQIAARLERSLGSRIDRLLRAAAAGRDEGPPPPTPPHAFQ